jgi:hypothetical protein
MRPDDLEDAVDRALKQLPGPRAPRTLVPRVMAAIETERARTSSARSAFAKASAGSRRSSPLGSSAAYVGGPWLTWPLAWQVASVAALVVLGVGIARLWPDAQSAVLQSTPRGFADVTSFVMDVASKVSAVANVTRIVWHGLVEPLVGYLLVLVLVMCAACATFGAALGRVALGGVSQT